MNGFKINNGGDEGGINDKGKSTNNCCNILFVISR